MWLILRETVKAVYQRYLDDESLATQYGRIILNSMILMTCAKRVVMCMWPTSIPLVSVLQTHLNPCFIQTNIVASPQPLEKDQWHCLKEGDIFSLMPGKYVYRVRLKEEDQTLRWFSLSLKATHLLFNNSRAESGWPCDDMIWQCTTCLSLFISPFKRRR